MHVAVFWYYPFDNFLRLAWTHFACRHPWVFYFCRLALVAVTGAIITSNAIVLLATLDRLFAITLPARHRILTARFRRRRGIFPGIASLSTTFTFGCYAKILTGTERAKAIEPADMLCAAPNETAHLCASYNGSWPQRIALSVNTRFSGLEELWPCANYRPFIPDPYPDVLFSAVLGTLVLAQIGLGCWLIVAYRRFVREKENARRTRELMLRSLPREAAAALAGRGRPERPASVGVLVPVVLVSVGLSVLLLLTFIVSAIDQV